MKRQDLLERVLKVFSFAGRHPNVINGYMRLHADTVLSADTYVIRRGPLLVELRYPLTGPYCHVFIIDPPNAEVGAGSEGGLVVPGARLIEVTDMDGSWWMLLEREIVAMEETIRSYEAEERQKQQEELARAEAIARAAIGPLDEDSEDNTCSTAVLRALDDLAKFVERALTPEASSEDKQMLADLVRGAVARYAHIAAYSSVWLCDDEFGPRIREMLEGEDTIFAEENCNLFAEARIPEVRRVYEAYLADETKCRNAYLASGRSA